MTGDCPLVPVAVDTHLKMLKTKRLQAFQYGAKLPFSRQAANWRKWETLWVTRGTDTRSLWRHEDCREGI